MTDEELERLEEIYVASIEGPYASWEYEATAGRAFLKVAPALIALAKDGLKYRQLNDGIERIKNPLGAE